MATEKEAENKHTHTTTIQIAHTHTVYSSKTMKRAPYTGRRL